MRYVTINKILACYPCDPDKVKKLAGDIDYDEPISFKQIYDAVSNLGNALWCIRTLDYDDEIQAFALRCSRLVEDFDKSGAAKKCNDALERYLKGNASLEALYNAAKAAHAACAERAALAARSALTASTASVALATSTASDAAWAAGDAAVRSARSALAARSDIVAKIESDFLATFCE